MNQIMNTFKGKRKGKFIYESDHKVENVKVNQ